MDREEGQDQSNDRREGVRRGGPVKRHLLAIAITLFASTAAAQTSRATLRVTVRDQSGAVIPNATVAIEETEKSVLTDSKGVATIENVPPGRYSVAVSFSGFETRTLTDLRLKA